MAGEVLHQRTEAQYAHIRLLGLHPGVQYLFPCRTGIGGRTACDLPPFGGQCLAACLLAPIVEWPPLGVAQSVDLA